jgi:hypothetical protein
MKDVCSSAADRSMRCQSSVESSLKFVSLLSDELALKDPRELLRQKEEQVVSARRLRTSNRRPSLSEELGSIDDQNACGFIRRGSSGPF